MLGYIFKNIYIYLIKPIVEEQGVPSAGIFKQGIMPFFTPNLQKLPVF